MKLQLNSLVLISFIILISLIPSVYAERKIAILEVTGTNANQFRTTLEIALKTYYSIVTNNELNNVKTKLNIKKLKSPTQMVEVAKELNISAFLKGRIFKAGRIWFFEVTVLNGANGEVVGNSNVSARNIPKLKIASKGIVSKLKTVIDRTNPPTPQPEKKNLSVKKGKKETREQKTTLSQEEIEALEKETPWSKPKFPKKKESELKETKYEMLEVKEPKEPKREDTNPSPYGYLSIYISILGTHRDFSLPVDPEKSSLKLTNISYNSGFYSSFSFGFMFFPGAIFTSKRISGLGLQFSFLHHIYLKTTAKENEAQYEIETKEYAYYVGVIYRLTMGTINIGAILYFYLGYGRESFYLGKEHNNTIPPYVYDYMRVGLNLYIPFSTHYIGIIIGGSYLGTFSIGEEASKAFSEEGDSPTANGFDFNIGLRGTIFKGLKWELGFELMGFSASYMGSGQGYDDDPNSQITTTDSSFDLFWRIMPKLIYIFGWDESPSYKNWYDKP